MAVSETLTVTLPEKLMRDIRDYVGPGGYDSTDEVMREAVEAFIREDRKARLEEIKAKIAETLADPRPSVPIEELRERMKRFYEDELTSPNTVK